MQESDQRELDALLATARVVRTLNSYYRAVDEQRFDAPRFRRIFAPDGKIVRPNGAEITGSVDIADSHARSFARFEASQHLLTGHDVDLAGATAEVREPRRDPPVERPPDHRPDGGPRVHRGRRRHGGPPPDRRRLAHHRSPHSDPVADRVFRRPGTAPLTRFTVSPPGTGCSAR